MASVSAADPPESRMIAAEGRNPYFDLFLISFLILFMELASIRWFGSTVIFLTFFTNLVLMACFLGMSVGCLAASRKLNLIRWVLPLCVISVGLSYAVLFAYYWLGKILIDVGVRGSAQQVFFGTEYRAQDPASFVVPIEVIAGFFYVLIALMFIGLGQSLGRAFDAIPSRMGAYTVNIAGSLVGIVAFGLASSFLFPPVVWFSVSALLILVLIRPLSRFQVACAIALIAGTSLVDYVEGLRASVVTIWSPYYKIGYDPKIGLISTNNIGHQAMVRTGESAPGYRLPYLLNRDANQIPFEDVMIIGAGSGNDVAAALASGAKHIDAVEIEPAINRIGRNEHPDKPYADPRVSIHLDDGRSFIRKTTRQYDLITYGAVDSLVLHSGYSSLRLESFLFTEQAFEDIKAKLKPNGMFLMSNLYRRGWIVVRLKKMIEKVFGTSPLVLTWPNSNDITAVSDAPSLTYLLVGPSKDGPVESIRQAFQKNARFWLNQNPKENADVNGFSAVAPSLPGVTSKNWEKLGPTQVASEGVEFTATDDWPFLYLREPTIPPLNLRGMAMVAGLSLVILLIFAPVRRVRPNGRMFFLGAGFMLLEAKGVVHMALLFGSTWIVNSIVFFAILVMILFSNLFVLAFRPRKLWLYYLLLLISLLINAFVPMSEFLKLNGFDRVITSCAVVFVPVFFAGVIFAASFRDSTQPDVDFGSNIGGVILGGMSEYLSLLLGFNKLLLFAIGFYVLSAIFGRRGHRT